MFRRTWQLLLVITLLGAIAASAGYWQNETPIGQTGAGDRMDVEGYPGVTSLGNDFTTTNTVTVHITGTVEEENHLFDKPTEEQIGERSD